MSARKTRALESVFGEVRLLFHRLRVVADELHEDVQVTTAMRGVLEGLETAGPQTVPAMARARPVSRQHIQTIVNELLKQKLVEAEDNPAHKSSPIVCLTKQGTKLIRQMQARERRLLSHSRIQVSESGLVHTAGSLRAIRKFFESKDWKETVNESKST